MSSVQSLSGGGSEAFVFLVNTPSEKLVAKIAPSDRPDVAQKLFREAYHLAASFRLVDELGVNLKIPEVRGMMKDGTGGGFYMSWIDGTVVSDLLRNRWTPSRFEQFYRPMLADLQEVWRSGKGFACRDARFDLDVDRPEKRMLSAIKRGVSLGMFEVSGGEVIINGKNCSSPSEVLGSLHGQRPLRNVLRPCISGDMVFRNVLATPDGVPVMIDPRGHVDTVDFRGRRVPAMNPIYDISKQLYCLSGWDQLMDGEFSVNDRGQNQFAFQLHDTDRKSFASARESVVDALKATGLADDLDYFRDREGQLEILLGVAGHFMADVEYSLRRPTSLAGAQATGNYLMATLFLDQFHRYGARGDSGDPFDAFKEIGALVTTERPMEMHPGQ